MPVCSGAIMRAGKARTSGYVQGHAHLRRACIVVDRRVELIWIRWAILGVGAGLVLVRKQLNAAVHPAVSRASA